MSWRREVNGKGEWDRIRWHFENNNYEPICKKKNDRSVRSASTTKNPLYVNCPKCLEVMKAMGITPEEDGWSNEE